MKNLIRQHSYFLVLILIITCGSLYFSKVINNYTITYVEYRMQENDSIFNVVQNLNNFMPFGWNVHDFVALVEDKNKIDDLSSVQEGTIVLIPIAYPKESEHKAKASGFK